MKKVLGWSPKTPLDRNLEGLMNGQRGELNVGE